MKTIKKILRYFGFFIIIVLGLGVLSDLADFKNVKGSLLNGIPIVIGIGGVYLYYLIEKQMIAGAQTYRKGLLMQMLLIAVIFFLPDLYFAINMEQVSRSVSADEEYGYMGLIFYSYYYYIMVLVGIFLGKFLLPKRFQLTEAEQSSDIRKNKRRDKTNIYTIILFGILYALHVYFLNFLDKS